MFGLYSFFLPQIVCNAMSGKKKVLLPQYYVGIGLSRLFFPLYLFGCPSNLFVVTLEVNAASNTGIVLALSAWVGMQLMVLALQDLLGARFFIPKAFLPAQYDYFRPLPHPSNTETAGSTSEHTYVMNSGIEMTSTEEVTNSEAPDASQRTWFFPFNNIARNFRSVYSPMSANAGTGGYDSASDMEAGQQQPECSICYNAVNTDARLVVDDGQRYMVSDACCLVDINLMYPYRLHLAITYFTSSVSFNGCKLNWSALCADMPFHH